MTPTQILKELKAGGKPCCQPQLYRYLKAFRIKPAGIRQRPQIYPADTAQRILNHLGLAVAQAEEPSRRALHARPARLISPSQLKAANRRATKGAK